MRKEHRLTKDMEYKRVRNEGHTWAHPLLVLSAAQNTHGLVAAKPQASHTTATTNHELITRWGFAVGRKLGKAVQRNRARRLLREAARHFHPSIRPGYDIVLIGRGDIADARAQGVFEALEQLLRRARLFNAPPPQGRKSMVAGQQKDTES